MRGAITWSFVIGLVVSSLDVLCGVPLAWLIVRRRGQWGTTILDSLADIPFIVPTVALGFSILEFWSSPGGIAQLFGGTSIVTSGVILIMLLHFAFSFPVIVLVMVGEFPHHREALNEVAVANPRGLSIHCSTNCDHAYTQTRRRRLFPLALAPSLSETGATIVVAGAFENGTVFISNARESHLTSAVVIASLVLIVSSLVVFALIKIITPRIRIAPLRVWPNLERKLSKSPVVSAKNVISLVVFLVFVLLPCLFIALPAIQAVAGGTATEALAGAGPWKSFWSSMLLSYVVAVLATIVNIVSGLPVAILIAEQIRNKVGEGLLMRSSTCR